ncbi:family 1 glycosylhydrolase [Agaribacter marinus]|uniref:Glycoside hydrolase family 1 protein n=1 Tax=Virgibacillus salarius TaxID=447199 RepID=A0A941DT32_9BACI|nr:glycoside hydrolase family 1 protein [Virgibacillus salarius]MBR7796120.1 glycoside hydrolase family 1 protein [Virgibacillus salarius]NAZ08829.1 family 1 glycosylhydrolase [Agaribacter marinus]WBX81492.1 glycoside hydrolase family 1 protein [Virgibacillus salarius]
MLYTTNSTFPESFLWAAGTSSYQCEGAHLTNGKTLSVVEKNINNQYADPSVASGHYQLWETDVELMKDLGLKAYRFSISWPRILPNGRGAVNQEGINFYRNIIAKLKEYHIEPIVTIYHFDLPQCLQDEYGGWSSRKIIKDFEEYCQVLFDHFGNDVKYWITINEQSNMFQLPYLMEFDEQLPLEKQKFEMNHIMTVAHAKAIHRCRQTIADAKIGPALGIIPNYPASAKPEDILAAKHADDLRTYLFMDLYMKGKYKQSVWNYMVHKGVEPTIEPGDMACIKTAKPDFIGINYYQSRVVKFVPKDTAEKELKLNYDGEADETQFENIPGLYEGAANPYTNKTQWDWEIDPVGLRYLLNDIYDRYDVPVLITENGIGTMDELTEKKEILDEERIDFLRNHLIQLHLAMQDGVKVWGYVVWSFIDLLSTSSGFRKRYGLVYIDRDDTDLKTLERIKKQSYHWYQAVITSNGQSL